MEPRLAAWAFLRPFLFAVAVAAAWIALSAAGASADSSAHNDPLLAAAPPTVERVVPAVTQQARHALEPMPARTASKPAPAPPPVPPLQAEVTDAGVLAGHVAAAGPVINTVVPEGSVAAAVDPALGAVDRVVGGIAVPVAGAVLEPLVPVLDPVLSAMPLPAPGTAGDMPAAGSLPPVADAPPPGGGAPAGAASPVAAPAGIAPGSALTGPELPPLHERLSISGLPHHQQTMQAAGTPQLPGTDPCNTPSHGPFDVLPGSAAGGVGSSSSHGAGTAAWLEAHNLRIPEAGPSSIHSSLPKAMPPVSFDPGSSPD